jgi:hypothetical protein
VTRDELLGLWKLATSERERADVEADLWGTATRAEREQEHNAIIGRIETADGRRSETRSAVDFFNTTILPVYREMESVDADAAEKRRLWMLALTAREASHQQEQAEAVELMARIDQGESIVLIQEQRRRWAAAKDRDRRVAAQVSLRRAALNTARSKRDHAHAHAEEARAELLQSLAESDPSQPTAQGVDVDAILAQLGG